MPPGLLVGGEREHDVAGGLAALAQPLADDGQHHRVHVLHVDRAAAPDAAVGDLAGERVVPPVGGVGGHDVEVAVDEQGGPGRGPGPRSGRPRWCAWDATRGPSARGPTSASSPATCSAASRSPGPEWSPGLVVSILIRSRQMPTTSSCAVTWFAVTPLSSHSGLSPVCACWPRAPAGAGRWGGKIRVACALAWGRTVC